MFGDQIVQTTFTGALSPPSATYFQGGKFRLYVDTTWAGLGGTEVTDALVDWRLSWEGGAHPKVLGSSSMLMSDHDQGENIITLEMSLERTAAVGALEALYRATTVTPQFIRLEHDSGVQIGAGDNHNIAIDLAGAYVSWQPHGRAESGNALDVVTVLCGKDSTGSAAASIAVTTEIAAI
jgi:hypothetical protein